MGLIKVKHKKKRGVTYPYGEYKAVANDSPSTHKRADHAMTPSDHHHHCHRITATVKTLHVLVR
eukprot:3469799-Rhodomonas_salina.1